MSADQIAYRGSLRWSDVVRPMLIIRGTAKLAALYGGEVHRIASGHLSHEIALTEVFLSKRQGDPTFEWTLVRAKPGGGPLPDAICASASIEVLGRYGSASVAAKLTLAATANLELW